MPQLPNDLNFEPSRATAMLWLGTRKKSNIFAGVTLPGMFQTYNFSKDASAFFLAILAEIIGLGAILAAFGKPNIGIIAGAVVAFALDMLGAYFLHKTQSHFTLVENKKILACNATQLAQLDQELSKPKLFKTIWTIFIAILAVVKILAFIGLSRRFTIITLLIIILYLLAAYIHIKNSGFFWWEWGFGMTNNKIQKEYKAFLGNPKAIHRAQSRPETEILLTYTILAQHEVQNHSLKKIPNESGDKNKIQYAFTTFGILTDSQLEEFILKQPNDEARALVAKAGLRLQLLYMGYGAPRC